MRRLSAATARRCWEPGSHAALNDLANGSAPSVIATASSSWQGSRPPGRKQAGGRSRGGVDAGVDALHVVDGVVRALRTE